MTSPNVCLSDNLGIDDQGRLVLQPWASPRPVIDVLAPSTADDTLTADTSMPGTLLIDQQASWINDTPLEQGLLVRITRAERTWIVSNPNAIQFRDRWTYAVNRTPEVPETTGIFNSQCGSSIDLGTNTVAEPKAGLQYMWADASMSDEWVNPLPPGDAFNLWYRCYRWTPPPWSDNANLNTPIHSAAAYYARIQVIAFPRQGEQVIG